MFNLMEVGLQVQAAGIGKYYRICNINESTCDLAKEAQKHNAILQRKGTRIAICTDLMDGYRPIRVSFRPDEPEAA